MRDLTPATMRWGSAISTASDLADAIAEAGATVRRRLGDVRPDLAIVFVSAHHQASYERVPDLVAAAVEPAALVGCSAGAVIGDAREIEGEPALSITAAILPNVAVRAFHVSPEALNDDDLAATAVRQGLGLADPPEPPRVIVLTDPFTADAERFVADLDRAYPGSRVVGGLASGGVAPGTTALYAGSEVYRDGVVGAALTGDVELDTIVAQGCRPVGDPMFATAVQRNVLYALDGRPAVVVLQELYRRLDPRDQALCRESLFLGIAMRDHGEQYGHGDFLVRNIERIDAAAGALGVGVELREGMVVQFHVRDARTSAEDLDAALAEHDRRTAVAPAGAVLFSCLARGAGLYGRPNHDSDLFRRHMGEVPLGGFFCNGEIGPVQGTTFVHGYTSAFGLFRPRG